MDDKHVKAWPPHFCRETIEPGKLNRDLERVHTRHYIFGFCVYDKARIYLKIDGDRVLVAEDFDPLNRIRF
jgi:hypothetical protein